MSDTEDEAVMRLSGRLVLDHITKVRLGFDLLDALVMLTITHANVEPIARDPELQRRYATYDAPPPNDMRRPISINALAQSLGIPFETVRRRAVKLAVLGLIRINARGAYVPTRMVYNTRHRAAQEGSLAKVRQLHEEMDRSGWGETYSEVLWTGDDPLRLMGRVSTEYLLRLLREVMEEAGDPLGAVVWLAIFCDNVAVTERGEARAIPGSQKPMSVSALARRLRLSAETVRRRIQMLVDDGLCVRQGSTAIVDADILARPGVQQALARNRQYVRRMFMALSEHGVTQSWREAERAAAA